MIEMLIGALGALVAVVAVLWRGSGKAKEEAQDGKDYIETRRKMDEAQSSIDDDPGTLRDWMRERGKSGGPL